MYITILFLPLLSFIIIGLLGRVLGRTICKLLVILCIFSTFLLSLFIFYEIGLSQSIVEIELYSWLILHENLLNFGLLFDSLTCIMILVISFISFIVHLYSLDYMEHDPYLCRFLSYLSLFTFFMEFLVTADNFLQLFIG
jgi:NADH-quinone oxidoreductase subunit L